MLTYPIFQLLVTTVRATTLQKTRREYQLYTMALSRVQRRHLFPGFSTSFPRWPRLLWMKSNKSYGPALTILTIWLYSLKCHFHLPTYVFFKNKFILFIDFWLSWVFIAACGLSLVAVSGGYSSLQCAGFSLQWLLLLWSMGSRRADFSSCSTQAQ